MAILLYYPARFRGIGYSVFGKTRWPEILLFVVTKAFLIRIHLPQMAVLETSFSCALALLGYFRGRLDGIGYSVFGKTRWPEILLFAVDSNFYAKLVEQFWRVFAIHERE